MEIWVSRIILVFMIIGAVSAVVCVAVSEMVMVLLGDVYAVTAAKVMAVVVLACVVRP